MTSGTVQGQDHEELRPLLLSIAHRMVGSVTEAEDLVQDAYLRVHRSVRTGEVIEPPKAYLSAIVTRLAIDHLRSARMRREQFVGLWLPEPLVTDEAPDPAEHAETAETLSRRWLDNIEGQVRRVGERPGVGSEPLGTRDPDHQETEPFRVHRRLGCLSPGA